LAGVISQYHFGGNKIIKFTAETPEFKKNLPAKSHFAHLFWQVPGILKIKNLKLLKIIQIP
jgi:hypothetical protein